MTEKSDTTRVGVALIGAGMIAQKHVEALSAARSRAQLLAIVSRHPENALYLARHYAGDRPEFTSDLTSIAHNSEVQVVIVATPPSVRIDLVEALARSGKHILLEKPVARTVDEAEQVVDICERSGVQLGVLFQHRVRATSQEARRLLAGGTLGKPGLIEIAVPLWREQSYYDELERGTYARDGGGVLITQAIHTIDLALSLAGPVTSVQALTATTALHDMESEDFAVAGLHFASGAVGSLVASTAIYPRGHESITMHCEHGSLRLTSDEVVVSWRDGQQQIFPAASESTKQQVASTQAYEWHQAVIEDFINAVQLGRDPLVTGQVALESHRLIQAIESSSREGVIVEMPV
ncbi:MAG: Gfo/Idh/MocA family oxidoreductase [Acidiferrobacterales bacterium]|nr:Gfo/Idh/MocA family oxidoreductase [Acidiferrobacterales bacterium]